MSNEAINWALTRQIKHSAAKFVLVVMANHADGDTWEAWPSIASLADATGQDRKTVMAGIKRLIELGFISDTGTRKGSTKQVPIYKLNETEIGTVKESQKRDSTKNGTVPEFPSNSTVFPHEQYQNSLVTVPKTGHGTINKPSIEPKENPKTSAQDGSPILELVECKPPVLRKTDRRDDTLSVFEYWQKKLGHESCKLDAKRVKAIKGRLADGYTVAELCRAVDGCGLSPYHQGKNDTNTVYDDIELICRDGPKVDNFRKIAERGPPTGRTANAQQTIDNLQAYLDQNP